MKRLLLLLPLGAVLLAGQRAVSQSGDDFGVLKTAPRPASSAPGLPPGVEPARPTANQRQAPVPAPKPFPLTREAGEWLICAAHYQGPNAPELARQVCVQLREQHHLNAYIHNLGAEERQRLQQEWNSARQANSSMPRRRGSVRIPDTYAVLVGGFADIKAASDSLPRIKGLAMPKLVLEGGKEGYDLVTYQTQDPETRKAVIKRARVNPFHSAMVVRNRLIPKSTAARPKWDPLWKKLNEDEEYSLLKNRSAWTLVVKEYVGSRVIQTQTTNSGSSSFLSALGFGGSKEGEGLSAAGAQAHELAKFLRHPRMGFKAYVLHTRYSSVVAVGEFTGPEDPNLQRVQRQLAELHFRSGKGQGDPIGLLAQPIPVEVPRP